jgi:hypothetical protein
VSTEFLQAGTDDQVKLAVCLDPFLFTQARLDDAAALHGQPDGRFVGFLVS